MKALYKVSGSRRAIAIIDVPSHLELDKIFETVPLVKEVGHGVELEILPITLVRNSRKT